MSDAPSAVRPVALRVENFRGLGGEHSLDLDRDLTLLVGKNASGKSSLLNAVEWCLFGAQVTKKSDSGIAERGDWALAHAGAVGHVCVTLEFEVEGGRARLTRRRAVDARPRDEDEVQLELPGDEVLQADEVRDWLAWNKLPDWSTWKRSFCQHQELSRERVTDTKDRSTAIAGMLGLDEYRQVSDALKGLRVNKLEQRAAAELGRSQDGQRRALERPGLELRDLEDRLGRHGISVAQAGDTELERRTRELLQDAQETATQLGLDPASIPGEDRSADEVLAWAQTWSDEVRGKLHRRSKERREFAGRVQALGAAVDALAPARREEADAKDKQNLLARELGSLERMVTEREELDRERAKLDAERRRRDAVGQLLRDALELVQNSHAPGQCPLCDQDRSDLQGVIQGKLDAHEPDALQAGFEEIEARAAQLVEHIRQLGNAQSAYDAAREQVRSLEEKVRSQLPAGVGEGAAIDELLRAWRADEQQLEKSSEAGERHVVRHRQDVEILDLSTKLRGARDRANASAGELALTPQFQKFQAVIDTAAGFASDIEALAAMARNLEDERSDERIAAVNDSIDTYFSTITCNPERGRVRVEPKKTATKVQYRLVDDRGRSISSHLNQAAFNALSLAALFASVESRARQGLPSFVVLDDPGQSLDDEHQAGLARAIARCATFAPVLVATFPGALADALSMAAVENAKTFLLDRSGQGAAIAMREA